MVPDSIPETSEDWRTILSDINKIIMPGVTHWQSPNFHAYYPTASSYPSIVGEMLSAGFSVIGFSWICSPACTELEVVVMDWLAKFFNLPQHFLHSAHGPGGEQAVKRVKKEHPEWSESDIRGKLIAYSSDQSNSCVEKAGLLAAVPFKLLPTDSDCVLRGHHIKAALEKDQAEGLIPIICIANVGTTGTCAFDEVESLGPVCQSNNIWFHVDAAYAGAGFAIEEYSHLRKGLELVDSLNFNLHKFLMVNFDCAAMWIRDANLVVDSFNVDRIYLKHQYEALGLVCFRLKGDNDLNSSLIKKITDNKKIYMVQGKYKDTIFIRFCVCGMDPQEKDVDFAWKEIQDQSEIVINEAEDMLNGNYIQKNMNIVEEMEGIDEPYEEEFIPKS
uniref:Aromatic-L-amino-acid decarboxylase n=1 Tax=Megaselia scalaris TaxID=36166 RepID=T1GR32_MEGSC